jgi:hypothetical protein
MLSGVLFALCFTGVLGHAACFWLVLIKIYKKDQTLAVFFVLNFVYGTWDSDYFLLRVDQSG